jgi:hypothetical protein
MTASRWECTSNSSLPGVKSDGTSSSALALGSHCSARSRSSWLTNVASTFSSHGRRFTIFALLRVNSAGLASIVIVAWRASQNRLVRVVVSLRARIRVSHQPRKLGQTPKVLQLGTSDAVIVDPELPQVHERRNPAQFGYVVVGALEHKQMTEFCRLGQTLECVV